jgi:hypothetical protein
LGWRDVTFVPKPERRRDHCKNVYRDARFSTRSEIGFHRVVSDTEFDNPARRKFFKGTSLL